MLTLKDIREFASYKPGDDLDIPNGFRKVESFILDWLKAGDSQLTNQLREDMEVLINYLPNEFLYDGIVYLGLVLDSIYKLNRESVVESYSKNRKQALLFTGITAPFGCKQVVSETYKGNGYLINCYAQNALDLNKLTRHILTYSEDRELKYIVDNCLDEEEVLLVTDYDKIFIYNVKSESIDSAIDILPCSESDLEEGYHFTYTASEESFSFYKNNKLVALANLNLRVHDSDRDAVIINAMEVMQEGQGIGAEVVNTIFKCFNVDVIKGEYISTAYYFWHKLGATKRDEVTPIRNLEDLEGNLLNQNIDQTDFILTKQNFTTYWERKQNESSVKGF